MHNDTNFLRATMPLDDLADLPVDQRLAAGNGDHRRAALVDRVEAFLHRRCLFKIASG